MNERTSSVRSWGHHLFMIGRVTAWLVSWMLAVYTPMFFLHIWGATKSIACIGIEGKWRHPNSQMQTEERSQAPSLMGPSPRVFLLTCCLLSRYHYFWLFTVVGDWPGLVLIVTVTNIAELKAMCFFHSFTCSPVVTCVFWMALLRWGSSSHIEVQVTIGLCHTLHLKYSKHSPYLRTLRFI